jgi:hypothetical protein
VTTETIVSILAALALLLLLGAPLHYYLLWRQAEARLQAERREFSRLQEHWKAVVREHMEQNPALGFFQEAAWNGVAKTLHVCFGITPDGTGHYWPADPGGRSAGDRVVRRVQTLDDLNLHPEQIHALRRLLIALAGAVAASRSQPPFHARTGSPVRLVFEDYRINGSLAHRAGAED